MEGSDDDDEEEFLKITTPAKAPIKEDVDEPMEDVDESSQQSEEEPVEEGTDDEDDEEMVATAPDNDANEDEDEDSSDSGDNEDSKEKLMRDAKKHKLEMDELKKRDPEFYKFLEKEDAGLLGFDMSEDEDDENDKNGDGEDADEEYVSGDEEDDQEINMQNDKSLVTVTKAMLAKWVEQIEKKCDSTAAKRLLAAFKSATRMADEEEREKTTFIYKVVDPNGKPSL